MHPNLSKQSSDDDDDENNNNNAEFEVEDEDDEAVSIGEATYRARNCCAFDGYRRDSLLPIIVVVGYSKILICLHEYVFKSFC